MTNRTDVSFSGCVRVKSHRLWAPPADGTPRAVLKLHPFGLEPNSGAPVGMSPRAALAALHARCSAGLVGDGTGYPTDPDKSRHTLRREVVERRRPFGCERRSERAAQRGDRDRL